VVESSSTVFRKFMLKVRVSSEELVVSSKCLTH